MSLSSWTTFFLEHFGSEELKNKPGNPLRIRDELRGKPIENLLNINSGDYFSFFFVRNPFDRLLSAFRDRLINDYKSLQADSVVPNILKEEGIENKITLHFAKAPKSRRKMEFVDNIIPSDLPTFNQFLRYVVKHGLNEVNEHWDLYTKTCSPCSANYTVIGRLETSRQDLEFILRESNLGQYAGEVEKQHETQGGPSINWRETYFSQVPCSLLKDVYEMYKLDFELFGYDPEEHLKLCKEGF